MHLRINILVTPKDLRQRVLNPIVEALIQTSTIDTKNTSKRRKLEVIREIIVTLVRVDNSLLGLYLGDLFARLIISLDIFLGT